MKPVALFVLMTLAITGCVSKEHVAWLEELKTSRAQWHACAMNATEQHSRQYSDPDMVARYALHVCEPQKENLIATYRLKREALRPNFMDFIDKDETRLRERMQMFATKWHADKDARLDQELPVPPVFGKP